MNIRYLSNKEVKRLVRELEGLWGIKKLSERMRVVYLKRGELLLNDLVIIRIEGRLMPFLKEERIIANLPKVVVDMGAVPHIVNGANVMRPGVVTMDEGAKRGELVTIVDEKHQKIIGIGILEVDMEEFKEMKKGVVVRTKHYVGDEFWEAVKELSKDN